MDLLAGLTDIQRKFVENAPTGHQHPLAYYMRHNARVDILEQDDDYNALPWAIQIRGTNFWVDCCETKDEARERALELGFRLSNAKQNED